MTMHEMRRFPLRSLSRNGAMKSYSLVRYQDEEEDEQGGREEGGAAKPVRTPAKRSVVTQRKAGSSCLAGVEYVGARSDT